MNKKILFRTILFAFGLFLLFNLQAFSQNNPPPGFPIQENFSTVTGWTLSGSATHDAVNGRLILTPNLNNQAGLAVYNTVFSSNYGIVAEFDYYTNDGIGDADGIAFFLVDGTQGVVTPGAFGGCLGYSSDGILNGIPNAYVGIGFDEFGNFSSPTSSPTGTDGPGQIPQSVTIRGSGNLMTGYEYRTHNNIGSISGGWRKARITITSGSLLTIQMSWDNGATWTTVINNFNINVGTQVPQPATYKLGFSGSTGGSTNNHWIDNVLVSVPVDLAVNISSQPPGNPYIPGQIVNYQFTVTNNGPNGSNIISVNDIIPAGLIGVSWNYNTSSPVNSGSGSGNSISQIIDLNNGGIATFQVSGTVSSAASGSLNHNVSASPGSGFSDPNLLNNSATVTLTVNNVPTVDSPTHSGIAYTTAVLGGNVASLNGTNVIERGIYWSTTNGFSPPGQGTKVSETGNWGTGIFSVNVTGLPAGTTIYYRAFATNSVGPGFSSQSSFTTAAPILPTVTTSTVTSVGTTTASSGGNVTSDGGAPVTARGVCWSTNVNPTIADSTTSNGTGTGSFTSSITGLNPGTTYHVRAYATNSVGTAYGSDLTFTTSSVLPTVTTTAISGITSNSAASGGNVTADGGAAVTARGVCWSTNVNPTTADSTTSDGTGTGSFTSSITGLNPGTNYHVRAYATNSVGTAYGSELTFTAGAIVPAVTTLSVSAVTSTTASCGGKVNTDGGSTITARGVCWSTSTNPRITDNKTEDGSGLGSFTSNLTGLMENTTYYVRAYATNAAGTGYGKELHFSTGAGSISVTITEPQDNAYVSGKVTIKATAASTQAKTSGASILGVEKVEFYVDGVKLGEDSSDPYEAIWDSTLATDGSHIIKAVAYNTANQTAQDKITVHVGNTAPEIMLNRTHLNYGSVPRASAASFSMSTGDLTTSSQTILINNIGGGRLNWTVTDDASWLSCTPETGTDPGVITVSADPAGLSTGTYNAVITISDPSASNSPQTIPVTFVIYSSGTTLPPFGYFETPIDGATVMSSIPVTGWALDDIDITGVKIYRAPIAGHETGGLVYIGEAVMIDCARPDVEQQFPVYPKDYQAGWGYMMLTNFLPNQGNGTFTIYTKITDKEGNEVSLGSKTITCNNADASRPFGAIDTPGQGGSASGKTFVNFGWVLTPQPKFIPDDGSTIIVWVDGVPLGNPVYNKYREDISTLFPDYMNSNAAGGYFYLNTTNYLNGVHTIAWSAEDSAGSLDGIGNRYFTIENIGTAGIAHRNQSGTTQMQHHNSSIIQQSTMLPDTVYVKKGFDINAPFDMLQPDHEGVISIQLRESQRVEISFKSNLSSDSKVFGYMLKGDRLQPLPIGSTMDSKNGIFYWQPGAGFFGQYRFVFVEEEVDGSFTKKLVTITIHHSL